MGKIVISTTTYITDAYRYYYTVRYGTLVRTEVKI